MYSELSAANSAGLNHLLPAPLSVSMQASEVSTTPHFSILDPFPFPVDELQFMAEVSGSSC